jgi:hypothetical protein
MNMHFFHAPYSFFTVVFTFFGNLNIVVHKSKQNDGDYSPLKTAIQAAQMVD